MDPNNHGADPVDGSDSESASFPYESVLEPAAAARLRDQTKRLRTLVLRTVENLISTGKVLLEVKAELEHGLFGKWLEAEFSWTDRTARNLMGLAEAFGDVDLAGLKIVPSALYALAAAPPHVRAEALELARMGKRVTTRVGRELAKRDRLPRASTPEKPRIPTAAPVIGDIVLIDSVLHGAQRDGGLGEVLCTDGNTARILLRADQAVFDYPIEGVIVQREAFGHVGEPSDPISVALLRLARHLADESADFLRFVETRADPAHLLTVLGKTSLYVDAARRILQDEEFELCGEAAAIREGGLPSGLSDASGAPLPL